MENMVKSMTGFGHAEVITEVRKLTVEIKSVNNRYLDFNIRMPKKFNFTLIIAQGAAILSYLPVGVLSTRFGRRKMILAGILTTEYPAVRDAFAALGCVELGNSTEREWTGGSFRTPAS